MERLGMHLVAGTRRQGRVRSRESAAPAPAAEHPRLTAKPVARAVERSVAPPLNPEPLPIWLSALLSAPCMAAGSGGGRAILWTWAGGRAVYTNAGSGAEWIEPFGVQVPAGHTLAVCWIPGETAYTTEVFMASERCA